MLRWDVEKLCHACNSVDVLFCGIVVTCVRIHVVGEWESFVWFRAFLL